jgi:hypothetical protein
MTENRSLFSPKPRREQFPEGQKMAQKQKNEKPRNRCGYWIFRWKMIAILTKRGYRSIS